jgi:spermidine/putrescine transport system substrate-binding protein
MTDLSKIDPSFLRGATMPRLSRRGFLRAGATGAGALGMASFLAACGTKGSSVASGAPTGADEPGSAEWWAAQNEAGAGSNVNFTNWPQYIDIGKDDQGNRIHPTLVAFTDEYGIDVTYRADINDNAEFYASIKPALEAGADTGSDLIVITNGPQLSEMIDLGYLIPLDPTGHPNFDANADPTVVDPAYDKGNVHTLAWQSGFTGIAWNTKYVDKDITSMEDLLDPAYAGHIGMMGNDDAATLALMAVGVAPETSTPEDWQTAADWLQAQKDSGVVRKYYVQDYLTAFENEDIWITEAWSGDILIDRLYYDRPEFEFTIPDEGGVIWTDNCCIPKAAANPVGAMKLMDWYYKPEIAAALTEYNNYVSPVPKGRDLVQKHADEATGADKAVLDAVATSPYVFPTPEIANNVHSYRVLNPEEEQQWNDLFIPIWQ